MVVYVDVTKKERKRKMKIVSTVAACVCVGIVKAQGFGIYVPPSEEAKNREIHQFCTKIMTDYGEWENKIHYKDCFFINKSDLSIKTVYVSMAESLDRGSNLIGENLKSGDYVIIKIPHKVLDNTRSYDIEINEFSFKLNFNLNNCNTLILSGTNGRYTIKSGYLSSPRNLKRNF